MGVLFGKSISRPIPRENVQQLADTTAANIANRYERSNSATLDAIGEGQQNELPSLSINDGAGRIGAYAATGHGHSGNFLFDRNRRVRLVAPNGSSYSSSNSIDETGSFAPSDSRMASASITLGDGQVVGTVQIWVYGSDLLLSKAVEIPHAKLPGHVPCRCAICRACVAYRHPVRLVAWCALLIASRKRRRKSRKATFRLA